MTRHLIDPELVPALDFFAPLPLHEEGGLATIREMFKQLMAPPEGFMREDVTVERRMVPGPEGAPDVPVMIYRPVHAREPMPALLHIHGGGYIFGALDAPSPANVSTAADLQCLVVSVDYRLAPETCAPGSVEDCYAALGWLYREASSLGVDRSRIAVTGESAGGGLAAALAQMARDRDEYPICFQLLIYPMLDDRTCVRSDGNPHVGEFVWRQEENRFGWQALLGCEPGSERVPPYAAPARTEDLSGLPPAYIYVGALDLFLEEDMDYARRLMRAGVPVELHVYPGAFHGFEMAVGSALAQRAEAERRVVLARVFSS